MTGIKQGDMVHTPRFGNVRIAEVFSDEGEARAAGYTEPTHYRGEEHGIVGKPLDLYHMRFAAFNK